MSHSGQEREGERVRERENKRENSRVEKTEIDVRRGGVRSSEGTAGVLQK